MEGDFVDTRLYISVRPFLEYEIPNVGHSVIRALIGDETTETALTEVDRLCKTDLCKATRVGAPDSMSELRSHCMRVVNHAIEHVRSIERDWLEFMRRTASGMRHEIRSVRHDIRDAKAVYDRYHGIHPTITEREYEHEMSRLQRRLDDAVNVYRNAALPVVARSDALKDATHTLRESFASAYGYEETSDLMHLRQHFESELAITQQETVTSFCRQCRAILQGDR